MDGLTAGAHAVALGGIAGNCAVDGENPLSVTITASQTATVIVRRHLRRAKPAPCRHDQGLPSGTDAAVTVSGPGGFSEELEATETFGDLPPGDYTVDAATVSAGATSYAPTPASRQVTVAAGATATATVTYAPVPTATLNLWIPGLNITQSVQTFLGDVPLVAGRDGLPPRVRAGQRGQQRDAQSARAPLHDGTLVETLTIDAPSGRCRLVREDGTLNSTWNVTSAAT